METRTRINGVEHWTKKGEVKLFLWQKAPPSGQGTKGTTLFVHGSSMAGQPTFDLSVPGRPDSSVMDWFAQRGFETWCMDMEGYGRSDKKRAINCDISNGADDLDGLAARARRIGSLTTESPFIASKYGDYRLFFKHSHAFLREELKAAPSPGH